VTTPILPRLPVPDPEPQGWGMRITLSAVAGITPSALDKLLPFAFQVPPVNSFPINRSYPWSDYDPIEGGQRSRRGSKQLERYSWRTLFTADLASWTLLHGRGFTPNPLEMLARLDRIATLSQQAGVPIFLQARHPKLWDRFDVNTPATIRSLNSEEGDDWDTRYVDIELVQWRDTSLQAKRMGGGSTRNSKLPVTLVANRLPVTQNTLYELAKVYYGDPTEWRRIAKENGLTSGGSENSLRITPSFDLRALGTRKIRIPRRS
jgi:hypothetical protein